MDEIISLIQKGYSIKFEGHAFYDNAMNIIMSKGDLYESHAILLDEKSYLSAAAQIHYVLGVLERGFENDRT